MIIMIIIIIIVISYTYYLCISRIFLLKLEV